MQATFAATKSKPMAMHLRHSIALFVILFIASLRSYYFFSVGASIDLLAVPLLLNWFLIARGMDGVVTNSYRALLACVFLACVYGLIVTLGSRQPVRIDSVASILLFSTIGSLWLSMACTLKREELVRGIRLLVIVHSVFLLLQFCAFYFLDTKLDFVAVITGITSRTINTENVDLPELGLIFRASGLYDEPGTFATFILPFLGILLIENRCRLSGSIALGLASVLLSFSSQGIVCAALLVAVSLVKGKQSKATVVGIVILVVLTAIGISSYIVDRFFGDFADSSFQARTMSLEQVNASVWGQGFVETNLSSGSLGTVFYWWGYCGPASILVLGWYVFFMFTRRRASLPLLLIVVSKIPASAPLYWLAIASIIALNIHRERSRGIGELLFGRHCGPTLPQATTTIT